MESASRLSEETFANEFTACSRTLWCVAVGVLGRRDQAEDVLQEGAMIALRKLDQFDPETRFVAWMSRIVRYVALNHARRRQRSPGGIAEPDNFTETKTAVHRFPMNARGELVVDQDSFDDDVLAALGGLDDTARACLLLRTVTNLPYREISRVLDVPEGTAMSHVHRARHYLRERLQHRAPSASQLKDGSR